MSLTPHSCPLPGPLLMPPGSTPFRPVDGGPCSGFPGVARWAFLAHPSLMAALLGRPPQPASSILSNTLPPSRPPSLPSYPLPGGRVTEVAVLTSCRGPRRSNEPNQREKGSAIGSTMNPLQWTAILLNMKWIGMAWHDKPKDNPLHSRHIYPDAIQTPHFRHEKTTQQNNKKNTTAPSHCPTALDVWLGWFWKRGTWLWRHWFCIAPKNTSFGVCVSRALARWQRLFCCVWARAVPCWSARSLPLLLCLATAPFVMRGRRVI